jgi:hypothetical protein
MDQMVEYLPNRLETLSSNPRTDIIIIIMIIQYYFIITTVVDIICYHYILCVIIIKTIGTTGQNRTVV